MRIHGSKTIRRRDNIVPQNDYSNYRRELREDFCCICGYCGMHERVLHAKMEIDHFVPDRIDDERKNDYYNLIYACFQCNRKKRGCWPTENKALHNDGTKGFVDPATQAYDDHLSRRDDGTIEALTDVGRYMFQTLRFDIRVTDIIWKASLLRELLDKLSANINALSKEQQEEHYRLFLEYDALDRFLFEKGE